MGNERRKSHHQNLLQEKEGIFSFIEDLGPRIEIYRDQK